jgi:hypothetical protein
MLNDNLNPLKVSISNGYDFNDDQPVALPNPIVSVLSERIKEAEIDLKSVLSQPPVCLSKMCAEERIATIGTLGNFSLLIGKAKSKKSFLIGTLAAVMLLEGLKEYGLIGVLPKDKNKILYFDTEQSTYHVQQAGKRILRQAGIIESKNLCMYSLRKYTPAERLEMIEAILIQTPEVGFVVIDGIRDLTNSINDEEAATMLSSKLLKWTEEQGIHIMCVLHQNKGDNNARGHLGSELVNKAESVLSVTKDVKNPNISIVDTVFCRDREFDSWAFEINSEGLPQHVKEWNPTKNSNKAKISDEPKNYPTELHAQVLDKIFTIKQVWKYSEMWSEIKQVLAGFGHDFGDNKAKKFLKFYQEEGLIIKKGEANSKSSTYHRV